MVQLLRSHKHRQVAVNAGAFGGLLALLLFASAATANAQSTVPIYNHDPVWVNHTQQSSVYFHGQLSPFWAATAVSYYSPGPATDYDLGLHETTNGNLVASSMMSQFADIIVVDGLNTNAGNDYILQVAHWSGQGGEYVEVSDSATNPEINLGMNTFVMPAFSFVRCYEVYLEAGRQYEFEMQVPQQLPMAAGAFLYRPTSGSAAYYDNFMGDYGHRQFVEDFTTSGVLRSFTAPTTGYYGFVIAMLYEDTVDRTFWVDVYDVTPGGGGGGDSIAVTPTSHTFNATQGGSNPSSRTSTLEISGGPVSWSASSSAGWLTVSPGSGTDTGSVTLHLNANIAGLAPGNHSANVTVSASGAANSPQTIQVTLVVAASSSDGGGGEGNGTIRTGSRSCASVPSTGVPVFAGLLLLLLGLAVVRRRV